MTRRGLFQALLGVLAARFARVARAPMLLTVDRGHFERVADGKRVWLGGGGFGWELQDFAWDGELPRRFKFESYLMALKRAGCNMMHLWCVEHERTPASSRKADPMPFVKVGSKYDLDEPNPRYFRRVRHRVATLRNNGMYAVVMLFQGASIWAKDPRKQFFAWPWHYMNQPDGRTRDRAHSGRLHRCQELYLEEMVHACRNMENVIWEVSNEDRSGSVHWQEEVMSKVRELDPLNRPVGMTFRQTRPKTGENVQQNQAELRHSTADWVGPKFARGIPRMPWMGQKAVLCMDDHFEPFAEIWKQGQVVGTKVWYPIRALSAGCAGYVHLDGGIPWYGGRRGNRARFFEQIHDEFRRALGETIESAE